MSGGFLFRFISRVGGPKAQNAVQKFIDGRELHKARQEAWDFARENYMPAMNSEDKDIVKKTLEAAEFGAGSTFDSLTFSHVAIGNLAGKLEKLEAGLKQVNKAITKETPAEPTNKM
jgi:hypothetical protein